MNLAILLVALCDLAALATHLGAGASSKICEARFTAG
jgi:hypothetical protein